MLIWESFTNARDFPFAFISLLIWVSVGEVENVASTIHNEAPFLIEAIFPRSPMANPKAPRSIDLPDPVSPVSTVNPFSNSRVISLIRAKSFICKRVSIYLLK